MKIKKSGDHRVRRDIDGVPTIQLGEGDVGVVTLHKGPPGTGPAGVGFLLSEGREQGDIDFHPDCSKMLLKIVSSNPEGLQVIINSLNRVKLRWQENLARHKMLDSL